MILMLKANQLFLKCFYGNTNEKYFGYSINIVLILAPGHNFFICAKCVQFALTFME